VQRPVNMAMVALAESANDSIRHVKVQASCILTCLMHRKQALEICPVVNRGGCGEGTYLYT